MKIAMAILLALSLFACGDESVMERSGETLDDAGDELTDTIEDAREDLEEEIEEAAN